MLSIQIDTILHSQHRPEAGSTVGDWQFVSDAKKRMLEIRVSELGNPDLEFLIALHELCEAWLCRRYNINESDVDRFDSAWQPTQYDEPGDDPQAPYHQFHVTAGIIERLMAMRLAINWTQYEQELETICNGNQDFEHQDRPKNT